MVQAAACSHRAILATPGAATTPMCMAGAALPAQSEPYTTAESCQGGPFAAAAQAGPGTLQKLLMSLPEIPSAGSAFHKAGGCKPCVFVHKGGCADGAECQFCHLCGPDEKKRRRKEKNNQITNQKLPKPGMPFAEDG
mmetsp:Transcript_28873/g.65367  ORF Transcript_28873/g.65367 Transcript_28873/m.65367 type:complete len:138 (-) Transcript_28873:92-505(-)